MRVLIVTKIFPNRLEPHSSPFNRQQFAALARLVDVEVFATIPWFPGAARFARWSRAGRLLTVPASERIDGLTVRHPRVAYLPRVGTAVSGPLYAASLAARAVSYRGRIDVVLGSWAYPDGYAAVLLGELLGVPAVVKLHGSDINVLAELPGARRGVMAALKRAERIVAVSRPLARRAIELGASPDRVDVVANGIDTALFHPSSRREARQALGLALDRPIAVYVGRVERDKGVLDLIHAFARPASKLRRADLYVVGDGSVLDEAKKLAERSCVPATFVGARPHAEVARWLHASDVLVLPSFAEGMPNVVLEALACGRRVIATRVGGIPEVISSDELGTLVPPRNPGALADGLERELFTPYDPDALAKAAPVIDWSTSAENLKASLLAALESRARKAA